MLRRQFSQQFKIDTVELTLKEEKTIKEIADDLGIRATLLYRWREKYHATKEQAFPGTGNPKDAESERIRQLERQLRLVTDEREILNKACAVFMKKP
ncbi:MAG: transposase [Chlorobiaceae bacterium]|nr:transposase [Chlorobiaceae bacterium]